MDPNKETVSRLLNYRNQAALQSIQLWKSEGEAEAYAEESKTLRILQKELCKRIKEVEKETKELEPLRNITNVTLQSLRQNLETKSMSVIVHNEHIKCLTDKVQKYKDTVNDLLDRYSKYIDRQKEELESDSQLYKILQDKKIQKNKLKLECMILEQRIKQDVRKNEVLKNVSNNRIVDFAKTWLERKKFEEKKNVLNQHIAKKNYWMCKLMEVTEKSKLKQNMRYIKDTMLISTVPQIKFSQSTESKPDDKKSDVKKDTDKIIPVNENNNSFTGLELLFENTPCNPLKQTTPCFVTKPLVKNTSVPRPILKSDHSKVIILDNQVLNSQPETHQSKPKLTREERSKEIEAKLQKVVTDFKRKISHQPSIEVLRSGQSKTNTPNTETKMEQQDIKGSKVTVEKNNVKEVSPSQELMLYSQEESEMTFVSQQSHAPAEENKIIQRNLLDINQNERFPIKPNKRKVTFATEGMASKTFFGASKKIDSSIMMENDNQHLSTLNRDTDVISMNFGGVAAGGTFTNFARMNNSPGLFKKPNIPPGNTLNQNSQTLQSQGLNAEKVPENLNLSSTYDYGDMSAFSDTGDYDAMFKLTDDYQETSGPAGNQPLTFNFSSKFSKFGWCKERDIISDQSLEAVREIVVSLRSNVHILGHGWLFRAGAAVHQGVVEEILRSIQKGHSGHIRGMLQAGWRLEASQALYLFLTRLQQPLIPLTIQSLVLDDNGNVPPEMIATDVLGLLKQELTAKHLTLTSLLLNLLDTVIKVSPADELRGNTLPTSMLPLFFNIQNQHMSEWRRIATIFVEVIRQASHHLETCFACDENNVRTFKSAPNGFNSSRIIEEFNRLESEPVNVYENAVTRRYLAPVGFRGDCNHMEIYHRNNHR